MPALPKKRKVNQKELIMKDGGLRFFFYSPPHGHKQQFGALMLTEDINISPEDVSRCSTTTTSVLRRAAGHMSRLSVHCCP